MKTTRNRHEEGRITQARQTNEGTYRPERWLIGYMRGGGWGSYKIMYSIDGCVRLLMDEVLNKLWREQHWADRVCTPSFIGYIHKPVSVF